MKRSNQEGFTIIELVVVIVLLGILAATALPRFLDVQDEAHDAVVAAVSGGLQTGISLYHAQWVGQGQPDANTALAEFGNLRTNAAGYPYGTADNSAGTSTVTTSADCAAVFSNVLQGNAPTIASVAALTNVVGRTEDFTAVATAPNCTYYYTRATSAAGATVPSLSYASATGILTQGTTALP